MVDELLSAYPHQLSFSEAGLRIMITSHFPPKTRLSMASRMLINEVCLLSFSPTFSLFLILYFPFPLTLFRSKWTSVAFWIPDSIFLDFILLTMIKSSFDICTRGDSRKVMWLLCGYATCCSLQMSPALI